MAKQQTSLRIILDKILRHPLMRDIPEETLVDYAFDFMRIVGCPDIFTEKTAELCICNFKASLPDDFISMKQVRALPSGICMRYTTDSFHTSNKIVDRENLTYKIQNSVIIVSFPIGHIEISYQAIDTDSYGYPMIPDNSSFTRALQAYVKKECFNILFDMNKISQPVFNQALQDYSWAVGDCQTEFVRMSIDEAESIFNSARKLIMNYSDHLTGFKNTGTKERIKIH